MNNPGVLISILLFAVAAFGITTMALQYVKRNQMAVERRVRSLRGTALDDVLQPGTDVAEKEKTGFLHNLSKLGFVASLGDELLAANIMVRPEEFLTIWFMVTIFPPLLLFMFTLNIVFSLLVMLVGFAFPLLYIKRKKTKKWQQFDAQLGDALLMMSNCLSGGLSFPQAMESIAREMPDPIAGEFARVMNEIRFGKTMDQAINDMIVRVKSQDLMIAMNAVLIQHQVGGNLAEILATIAETVKDRIQIKKDVRVMTSQGRLSGNVIALLPVFLFLVISGMNPSYMSDFLKETIGQVMLIIGIVMEFIGYMLIMKIVDVQY